MGFVATITAVFLLVPTLLLLVPWGLFAISFQKDGRGDRSGQITEIRRIDKSGTTWSQGKPEAECSFSLPPGTVATISLIQGDQHQTNVVPKLQGYLMASDEDSLHGVLQLGSHWKPDGQETPFTWSLIMDTIDGSSTVVSGSLPGKWIFQHMDKPPHLTLIPGRVETIRLAEPYTYIPSRGFTNAWLALQFTCEPREGSGVPDQLTRPIIRGARTNWLKHWEAP